MCLTAGYFKVMDVPWNKTTLSGHLAVKLEGRVGTDTARKVAVSLAKCALRRSSAPRAWRWLQMVEDPEIVSSYDNSCLQDVLDDYQGANYDDALLTDLAMALTEGPGHSTGVSLTCIALWQSITVLKRELGDEKAEKLVFRYLRMCGAKKE